MNFFYTFPLSTLSSAMCRVAVSLIAVGDNATGEAESKLSRTRNSKLWLSRHLHFLHSKHSKKHLLDCQNCEWKWFFNGKMKISRTSQLKKESERGEGEGEMRRPQGKGNYIAIGKVIENQEFLNKSSSDVM